MALNGERDEGRRQLLACWQDRPDPLIDLEVQDEDEPALADGVVAVAAQGHPRQPGEAGPRDYARDDAPQSRPRRRLTPATSAVARIQPAAMRTYATHWVRPTGSYDVRSPKAPIGMIRSSV